MVIPQKTAPPAGCVLLVMWGNRFGGLNYLFVYRDH